MVISPEPILTDRILGADLRRSKLRVAIGLFADWQDACATAGDLEAGGTAAARIGFAARPQLFQHAAIEAPPAARPARSYSSLHYCAGDDGCFGAFIVVPPVEGDGAAAEFRVVKEALNDHLHRRSLRHQERQLHAHLLNDGWLLIVQLIDASEQHAVCSTLLRRARFGVQSHEMRR